MSDQDDAWDPLLPMKSRLREQREILESWPACGRCGGPRAKGRTYCAPCASELHAQRQEIRSSLDLELLADMVGNACEICQSQAELEVDHDHVTGRYRGLLCGRCNRALGLLGDSPELLARAALYLLESRK